ncbi:MAG: hypothetical protein RIR62_1163 [Pseudomonadota bacterium]|jgi:hypothetical protein
MTPLANRITNRTLTPALILSATPALAHDGLHFHPHGIEFGWLVAALLAVVAGGALVWFRGRK